MKLSNVEFRAMQSFWRQWGHQYFEMQLFNHLGLEVK
jgi:hypothetical protein